MDTLDAILLGIVQGLTEFLPISSSGHLALAQYLLGYRPEKQIFFDLLLHLGTLIVIIAYYRGYLAELISELFSVLREREGFLLLSQTKAFKLTVWILISSFFTALVAVSLREQFEFIFSLPPLISVGFAFTGIVLLLSLWGKERGITAERVGLWRAVIIGIAQGIAVAPGISRSGMTIVTALLLGVERKEAAKYSFLMAIPAIGGGFLLEAKRALPQLMETSQGAFLTAFSPMLLGLISSVIAGYLALKFLISFVNGGKLFYFSIYLLIVAPVFAFSHWSVPIKAKDSIKSAVRKSEQKSSIGKRNAPKREGKSKRGSSENR